MKTRKVGNTEVAVSEVGFGLWTVSTGWWGDYTDDQAVDLMRTARDLGITLFDAADTYGNGRSEDLLGKAFGNDPGVVVATKVGYDFVNHGEGRRGQREIPQNFSAEAIRQATEAALTRLKRDRIDILQLHNIRMEQVEADEVWETLEALKQEGKILASGAALGPAIGWLGEGVECVRRRRPDILQHIYNMLEQHPGRTIQDSSDGATSFLIRVPHSSGMLEGHYTEDTVFPPGDHRNHRPRSWLINGVKKVEQLRFLERDGRTLGQAALQWLLSDPRTASTLPNIYNKEQLAEFAAAPAQAPLSDEELKKIDELYTNGFGLTDEDPPKFKGTMELSATAVV